MKKWGLTVNIDQNGKTSNTKAILAKSTSKLKEWRDKKIVNEKLECSEDRNIAKRKKNLRKLS